MKSTDVIFFCSLYLLFFFIIGALAGITTFPPPAMYVGFDVWELDFGIYLSFWDMAGLMFTVALVLTGTFLAGIKVFGTGIEFDQKYIATMIIAFFVGGLVAWTMAGMLVGVPLYVSAVLVWPFVGAVVYSIVSMGAGGG